jgi:hypothetical protein
LTNPDRYMCGILGDSRSPFCNSANGFETPSCEREVLVNNVTLERQSYCPEGLACPNDTSVPITSTCRTNPIIKSQPCACQCSLCEPACNPGFGVCRTDPFKRCACIVPGTPCIDVADHQCSGTGPCTQSDLCGGSQCDLKVNECRTLSDCDSSQLWTYNITHPCVCNGHGLCNLTGRACECYDDQGTLTGNALYSASTRCLALDSCVHCNSNPSIPGPTPSRCIPIPGFPAAFNCTCSPYWYTSGSFQNTPGSRSSPIFQCSTGTCIGAFRTAVCGFQWFLS